MHDYNKVAAKIRRLIRKAYENRHDSAVWEENPHVYFDNLDTEVANMIEDEVRQAECS